MLSLTGGSRKNNKYLIKISAAAETWAPRQNHTLLFGPSTYNTDGRNAEGYRDYDNNALQKLVFTQRARIFGFSIDECHERLGLYEDQNRPHSDVKHLANLRLKDIEQKQNIEIKMKRNFE